MEKNNKQRILMSAVSSDPVDAEVLLDKLPNTNTGLYVPYGKKNNYPNYLNDLVQNCSVLNSIVNSIVDYVLGSDMQFSTAIRTQLNGNKGSQLKQILNKIVYDKVVTGAWALKLTYNRQGEIAEIQWLDIRNVRLNYDMNTAYYSETFSQGRRGEMEVYSLYDYFEPGKDEHNPYACIFYDNGNARGVYAVPSYSGALRSILTNIEISKFHLASIQNNLSSNAIINIPGSSNYSEEEKRDIELKFHKNFTGSENGSSFMLAFCDSNDDKVTVERIQDDGFDKKYDLLSKDVVKNIFTAFRIQPQLCGYTIEGSLFNKQEFTEAFELFNVTVIRPIQHSLVNSFNYLFNTTESLDIIPFKID